MAKLHPDIREGMLDVIEESLGAGARLILFDGADRTLLGVPVSLKRSKGRLVLAEKVLLDDLSGSGQIARATLVDGNGKAVVAIDKAELKLSRTNMEEGGSLALDGIVLGLG
ncbi:MAG: hypothetical protein ACYTFI_09630 [Planctomycetota bacterium]|jgi:hypothetical protein